MTGLSKLLVLSLFIAIPAAMVKADSVPTVGAQFEPVTYTSLGSDQFQFHAFADFFQVDNVTPLASDAFLGFTIDATLHRAADGTFAVISGNVQAGTTPSPSVFNSTTFESFAYDPTQGLFTVVFIQGVTTSSAPLRIPEGYRVTGMLAVDGFKPSVPYPTSLDLANSLVDPIILKGDFTSAPVAVPLPGSLQGGLALMTLIGSVRLVRRNRVCA